MATKFKLTPSLVHRLHKAFKADDDFIQKLEDKENARHLKIKSVVDAAKLIEKQKEGLLKAAQV